MGLPATQPHSDNALQFRAQTLHIDNKNFASSVIYPQTLSAKEKQTTMLWLLNQSRKDRVCNSDAQHQPLEKNNFVGKYRNISFNNKVLLTFSILVFSIFAGLFGSIAAQNTKALMMDGIYKLSIDSLTIFLWVLFGLSFLSVLTSIWALVLSFLQKEESKSLTSSKAH